MRTEYVIKLTDPKGNVSTSVYPKKYGYEKAQDYKNRLADWKVEFFKVVYYGSSFHHEEKIF